MNKLAAAAAVAMLCAALGRPAHAGTIGAEVVFTDAEIATIRAWYRDNPVNTGGGRHKPGRNGLPPGIAKNLGRGKPLPPGIAKQVLPGGLVATLPPVRQGYERIVVDGKVLLVEVATQIVHDVLSDAILR